MTNKNLKLIDKQSTFIGKNVIFGENVVVYEGNRIDGETYIGDNTIILPHNYIIDSRIGSGCKIHSSVIEESVIKDGVIIGPFARIRPGSLIGDGAKIGNFCEVKNSKIGKKTKINHMSYVGDANVGSCCNIGCGVIFANFNGKNKSQTVVGDNCFVGSNVNLIAPIKIEDNSYICAGTTVVHDVKNGSFVIGRARAEEKVNRAKEYLKGIDQ